MRPEGDDIGSGLAIPFYRRLGTDERIRMRSGKSPDIGGGSTGAEVGTLDTGLKRDAPAGIGDGLNGRNDRPAHCDGIGEGVGTAFIGHFQAEHILARGIETDLCIGRRSRRRADELKIFVGPATRRGKTHRPFVGRRLTRPQRIRSVGKRTRHRHTTRTRRFRETALGNREDADGFGDGIGSAVRVRIIWTVIDFIFDNEANRIDPRHLKP